MISPLFSIVIPTFNRSVELRRALLSVSAQTFRDFEVLVCDDGSADNTKEVVESFARKMQIKYLQNDHFGGPARPRNNGIMNASGKWICFLDSDDWWYPAKLEVVQKLIHRSDLIYHDLDVYSAKGKKFLGKIRGRHLRQDKFSDLMRNANAIPNSAAAAKKSVIEEAGGFEENKGLIAVEDFDLWLKIARLTSKFTYIKKSLGVYWMEKSGLSGPSQRRIIGINAVYGRHAAFLSDKDRRYAEMLMHYSIALLKQDMGLTEEALLMFKKCASMDDDPFLKMKALVRIVMLDIASTVKRRQ
ncbi:MAG: glycosyltransferase [Thermodesulfovibrionales bacterium]